MRQERFCSCLLFSNVKAQRRVHLAVNITMKELLEAGVHFGHQTKRWNPKMKEFIFGERNGIYIIDLQKTLKLFKEASKYVQDLASEGKSLLFVGTKRQAQDAIAEEAQRAIRLFASKIADSVVEGAQAATDKQAAELSAAQYSASAEGMTASGAEGENAEGADTGEDISMEDVLGGPTRKQPATAAKAE